MLTARYPKKRAIFIALLYFVIGILWIYFSDTMVANLAKNDSELKILQTYKGFFYVSTTAVLLYILVLRFLNEQFKEYNKRIQTLELNFKLENSLQKTSLLLHTIINSTPDAIFVKDLEGKYLLFNRGASDVTGKSEYEAIGNTDELLFSPAGAKVLRDIDQNILKDGVIRSQEEHLSTLGGEEKVFWATKGPIYNEDGSLLGLFGISRDITERKQNEIQLLKHKTIFDNIGEGVYAVDLEDRCTYINAAGLKLLGLEENEVIGQFPHELFHYNDYNGKDVTAEDYRLRLAVLNADTIHIEHRFRHKGGSDFPVHVTVSPVTYDNEQVGAVITFEDITKEKEHEYCINEEKNRFDYMAHHDTLTGLPNRLSLVELLEVKTTQERPFALMFIDLDGFKEVNDSYGHRFGDQLLIIFSQLLQNILPDDAFVARTGGDEFVILLSCNKDQNVLHRHMSDLTEKLDLPFKIGNVDVYITASIGIALYPLDATTTEELLQNADAAMYNAKQNGKNTYSFFNSRFTDDALFHITLSTNLKKALLNQEFTLYFQPQVDPNSNQIVGSEALIRWFTPEGAISPADFIPIAEESGFIIEIGNFVLKESFKTAKKWADSGILVGRIAVNVAARQFVHTHFIATLNEILNETQCDPKWIELEITERSIILNPEKVIIILNELRTMGFHISIDDFGTGYSSLSYLKNLPINKLKIDISFIRDIMHQPKNQTIVKTIIALAKGLDMEVLAEGVEAHEEMVFLRDNGIDSIQGFYYYKPVSSDAIEMVIRNEVN